MSAKAKTFYPIRAPESQSVYVAKSSWFYQFWDEESAKVYIPMAAGTLEF